jgi:hypothetical protein
MFSSSRPSNYRSLLSYRAFTRFVYLAHGGGCLLLAKRFIGLHRSGIGATTTSDTVRCDVRFRAEAKLAATADMRRKAVVNTAHA